MENKILGLFFFEQKSSCQLSTKEEGMRLLIQEIENLRADLKNSIDELKKAGYERVKAEYT